MSDKLSVYQDNTKQYWLRNAVATSQGWFDKDTKEQLTYDNTLIERGATPVASWEKQAGNKKPPVKVEEEAVEELENNKVPPPGNKPNKKKKD